MGAKLCRVQRSSFFAIDNHGLHMPCRRAQALVLVQTQRRRLLACAALRMALLQKLSRCQHQRAEYAALQRLIGRVCGRRLVLSWIECAVKARLVPLVSSGDGDVLTLEEQMARFLL
jgi:hypothetical protein